MREKRLRKRASRKLKQMRTYMHHGAFRSFTAGSFHLRPVRFYFSYDELLWSPAVIVTASPNALRKQRRGTNTLGSMECANERVLSKADQFHPLLLTFRSLE